MEEEKPEQIVEEIPKVMEDIKKNLKTENLIIGTEKTIKMLKTGKLAKVFLASNAKKETEQDLRHYTKIANVELVKLDIPNAELGIFCKKTFSISVMGLVK